ncbi:MAG: AAA family ATPase [Ruminiclostridium sp.]|nr:AAA family ATPase [Ruminiclostridium sp.]
MSGSIFSLAFEAESALIGCLLFDSSIIADLADSLSPDDFQDERNRAAFQSALTLHQLGRPIDPVQIHRGANGIVDTAYLASLMEATVTTTNFRGLADEIRNSSLRRRLFEVAERLREDAASHGDPQAMMSAVQAALAEIDSCDTRREILAPADQVSSFFDLRSRIDAGARNFVPTGYSDLDKLLGGGMLCGGLYILAARPAVGKTTFALSVADQIAEKVGAVLFVSLEMDADQLTAKRLARVTGVSASRLLMGELNEKEYDEVTDALLETSRRPLYVNKAESVRVADIDTLARRVPDLRCIVVDYLGLIRPDEKGSSRYENMTAVSGSLKALARRRGVPVLCLAQLNRANMDRKEKRPQLSDLRDTGAIEQDADAVMFLHREDYYQQPNPDQKPWDPRMVDLLVAKNRHAGTGDLCYGWYPQSGRYVKASYGRG